MPTRGESAGSTRVRSPTPPVSRRTFPRPASSSATRPRSLASTGAAPSPRASFPRRGPYTCRSWWYKALTGECAMEDTDTACGISFGRSGPGRSLVSTTCAVEDVSNDTELAQVTTSPASVACSTVVVWSSRNAPIAPVRSDDSWARRCSLA